MRSIWDFIRLVQSSYGSLLLCDQKKEISDIVCSKTANYANDDNRIMMCEVSTNEGTNMGNWE